MELSPLDIKILQHLKYNGLGSTREMANILRISPATLDYKLKRLEDEEVITGYKYRVDYKRLGFGTMAWVFLGVHRHGVNLDKLVEIMMSNPNVQLLVILTGDHDMAVKMFAKGIEEVSDFVMDIKTKLKGTLRYANTIFSMKTYKLNHTILNGNRSRVRLDKSDISILKHIMADPRAKIKDVADELGLHRNTVSSKIKELHDTGVLLKRSVIVNPKYHHRIGIEFKSIVFMDAVSGSIDELAKKLAKCDKVHEVFAASTEHDIMAIVRTKDIKELSEFQVMLYSDPEYKGLINDTKTMCILNVLADRSDEPACIDMLAS